MTFLDRIKETSTSTGIGTFTLGGAVLGYKVFTNGTYKYCIVNETESEWEVGEGSVASGVLTRTTIEASSNGGAAVSFSAGTKYVFNTVSAAYVNSLVPYTGATVAVNLGSYGLTSDYLQLSTTPTATGAVGRTLWNDQIGSTETTLKGGSVVLKNGVDLVARVVNKVTPAATLTKATYKAVRVSGAQGQRLAIAYAQANTDNNSADTIGLVCETIAANQEGFIITVGQLTGINTTGSLQGETWADGDVLYLSPTTAGNLTNIKPTGATGHIVVIGYVEYAHAINGSIYVKIMNGWELDELHNVYINAVANNDVLVYESSSTLWKNKSIATILGYTPADDSLVVHLAGAENITGVKTFQNALQTTTGNNLLNTGGGNTVIGYTADPASSATYKLDVNGGIKMFGVHLIQSNVGGGNTFLTISNQAGTAIATLTNGGALQFSGTATFSNTIGFNGKIGSSATGGIAIVPGGVPSSLNDSQIMLLVSAPLVDYTSTYGLNEQGIFLGGTYNGGQGPTRMILGPSRYYNAGGTATSQWNFTIQPASGQVTDGYGSNLILAGGQGRGTGTPGKFIVQTSTATTTGTTLQTLSNRLEVDGTGQLKLNGYTSTSVFTGTVAGLLGFDSSGNVITSAAGVTGSGTAGQITYWSGTSAVTGSSNLFWDATNSRLSIAAGASPAYRLQVHGSMRIGTTAASAMYWDDTNNRLGVGTSSPITSLHVVGNALFAGTGGTTVGISTTANFLFDAVSTAGNIAWYSQSLLSMIMPGNNTGLNIFPSAANENNTTSEVRVTTRKRNNGHIYQAAAATNITSGAITGAFAATGTYTLDAINNLNGALVSGVRIAESFTAFVSNHNAAYAGFTFASTINQSTSVGLTAVTRGVYLNPTLTSVVDYRAIEWTNNTGAGIYATGTAPNYVAGNFGFQQTSPTAIADFGASTTSRSSLRIRSGTAPTSPNDGDIWYDGTNIYIRVGTTTKTFTIL